MTKKAVFEVATLADAVAKAARIAPNKGAAFDRAAGIVVEVRPNSLESVVIKSTDLDVTFRQVVSVLELGDEDADWRVPSSLFNGIMSTLPMGSGSQVRLADNGDSNLYFLCNKTKAKLRQISTDFPLIIPFDATSLASVPGLAKRLTQVSWAADSKGSGILSGIHISGDFLFGCNRQVLAMVPCVVPVDRPVTAPLTDIASLLKNTSEVAMRAGRTHLELMPDAWTQTTCILYAGDYPDVRALIKNNQTGQITLKAEALVAALDKMLVLVKSERYPTTTIKIGDGSLYLEMEVDQVGKIADELEVQGGETGDPFVITFSPDYLKQALMASGRETVTIKYGPTSLSPLLVVDDNQFTALMMPHRK